MFSSRETQLVSYSFFIFSPLLFYVITRYFLPNTLFKNLSYQPLRQNPSEIEHAESRLKTCQKSLSSLKQILTSNCTLTDFTFSEAESTLNPAKKMLNGRSKSHKPGYSQYTNITIHSPDSNLTFSFFTSFFYFPLKLFESSGSTRIR